MHAVSGHHRPRDACVLDLTAYRSSQLHLPQTGTRRGAPPYGMCACPPSPSVRGCTRYPIHTYGSAEVDGGSARPEGFQ
eukprot:4591065-Prymnesium_polylepis.1